MIDWKLYLTVVEQGSMNIQRIQKNMAVSDQLLLTHFMGTPQDCYKSNICKLYQTVVEQGSMNIQRTQKNMAVSDQLLHTHFMGTP